MTTPSAQDILDVRKIRITELFADWQTIVDTHSHMFTELQEVEIEPSFDFNDRSIAIRFAGDQVRLQKVWNILRRAGFKPDKYVEAPTTEFYTWFDKVVPGSEMTISIWFSFTSSVCKRVKVGTRTITEEQDIYEVRCGEES
jgi:hypothetical protein